MSRAMEKVELERKTRKSLPTPLSSVIQTSSPILERRVHEWAADESVLDILLKIDPHAHSWKYAAVTLDGTRVKQDYWHVVFPKIGTAMVITVPPKDSKILTFIAIIALAIVAPQVGFLVASSGLASTATGAALLYTATTAAVFAVGTLAINSLIAPTAGDFQSGDDRSQALSIEGARNKFVPFGVMPMLLGKYKVFPPYASRPISSLVGNDQYINMLFCLGYKDIEIDVDTIKIGDAKVSTFNDAEMEVVSGGSEDTGSAITLTDEIVNEQTPGIGLGTSWSANLATADPTDRVEFEINFPSGLIYIHSDGDLSVQSVVISAEYSATGIGGWTPVPEFPKTFSAISSTPFKRGFSISLSSGEWFFRFKASVENDNVHASFQIYWERFLSIFRSFQDTDPVQHPDAGELAIKIRATDQLNGVPSSVNYIGQSILPDWNEVDAWDDAPTSNCASLARYLLTSPKVNARPLAVSRLDDASFQAFWTHCDTNNFTFNQLIDFNTTLWDLLLKVCAAGRARPLQIDGLWSIGMDTAQSTSVQVFTPRNSWGFQGSKVFPDVVHAFRVRFVDEVADYATDEQIVYADGFTSSNATNFESIEFTGVTNWDHIWKQARYYLAVARLQPEIFTFSVDIEHLVCLPMDRIEYQDDVIKVGLGGGRVVSCTTTTLVLDAEVIMDNTKADGFYGVQFRNADGTVTGIYPVETETGAVTTLIFFPLEDPAPAAEDDIVVFGEVGAITIPLIVKNIRPGEDLSATLECLPYSADIYTADTGVIPGYDPVVTNPVGSTQPIISSVRSDEVVMQQDSSGSWKIGIQGILGGLAGDRDNVHSILIQWRSYIATNNVTPWNNISLPPEAGSFFITEGPELFDGAQIEIRALYFFNNGSSSPVITWDDPIDGAFHTVIGRSLPPPDVETISVFASADGSRIYDWNHSEAILAEWPKDVFGYEIRYWFWAVTTNNTIVESPSGTYTVTTASDHELLAGEIPQIADAQPGALNGFHTVLTVPSSTSYTYTDTPGIGDASTPGVTNDPLEPDWDKMTKLRTHGVITEAPYESNAPGAGKHVFAIRTLDDGLRESVNPAYTNVIDLPLPRLGDSILYKDAWALGWVGTLTSCFVDSGTGYLKPDTSDTWTDRVYWDGPTHTDDEWQLSGADPIYFEDTPIDFGSSTSVVFNVVVDVDTAGGATVDPIEIREGADAPALAAASYVTFNPSTTYTNFMFQFKYKGNSIPTEGIRNIILSGFAP